MGYCSEQLERCVTGAVTLLIFEWRYGYGYCGRRPNQSDLECERTTGRADGRDCDSGRYWPRLAAG